MAIPDALIFPVTKGVVDHLKSASWSLGTTTTKIESYRASQGHTAQIHTGQ